MIIKVSKYNGLASGHQYNISKRNGELITSNMHSLKADDIKKEFQEMHSLNPRCNETYQFVISLAQGESFNQKQWNLYVREVLEEFGLTEHKYYAMKHNDTDNQHVHLVVSGVNPKGKPSPKMRGFYKLKASELALNISKRDQHQEPVKNSLTTEKGVNQARYALDKIIRREIKKGTWTGERLREMELDLKSPKPDKAWEFIIGNPILLSKLKKEAQDSNYKTLISRKLVKLKQEFNNHPWGQSRSIVSNWIKFCREQGLYARELKKDGSIVYGMEINGQMRYFNEKQLHEKFDKQHLTRKDRTFILDRVIKRHILYAKDLKELNNRLEKNNITMNFRINATGLYGVVFQDKATGESKSLSSLGLKIGSILKLLNVEEARNIEKMARQRTSLTVPAKIIIFAPANSKFIHQQVKAPSNIHSSINANAAKVLDREQYENHQDDLYDRRKKTI